MPRIWRCLRRLRLAFYPFSFVIIIIIFFFFFSFCLLFPIVFPFVPGLPAFSLSSLPVADRLLVHPVPSWPILLLPHRVRSHATRIATLKRMGECHLDDSCRFVHVCVRSRVPETHAEDVSSLPATDQPSCSGGFDVFLPVDAFAPWTVRRKRKKERVLRRFLRNGSIEEERETTRTLRI